MKTNEFYLPILDKITIYDYSLYKCPFEIDFSSKLNIIYGTNGVGKSTLLMIILFSIIGPYKGTTKTQIRLDKRRDNRPLYYSDFFKDRMLDVSESARVVSEFHINKDKYKVTHSLFDCSLLEVIVNGSCLPGKTGKYKEYENLYFKGETDSYKTSLIYSYQQSLSSTTLLPGGINTLINMLQDVMLFDEDRHLTFWNPDLQEVIIGKYIVDAGFYERFCEQKLNTKAAESAYKKASETHNFMLKFLKKEKDRLNSEGVDTSNVDLTIELNTLQNEIVSLNDKIADERALYERKNSELLKLSSNQEKLKEKNQELEKKWYDNILPDNYNNFYKKFSKKMMVGICPVCGNNHSFDLKTEQCIMCNEQLHIEKTVDILKIDIERRDNSNALAKINNEILMLKGELKTIINEISDIRTQINNKQERINKINVYINPDNSNDIDEQRLSAAQKDRDVALKKVNSEKIKENQMREQIKDLLAQNFDTFRKSFIKYALSFFGNNYTVDIKLPLSEIETSEEDNILHNLMTSFILNNKRRDEYYMLSESQRIFTDFAFRFSILTNYHKKSFFICETPDSTLDMFHEENAVNTFKQYINAGNSLVLTANARRSNLIFSLYNAFPRGDVNIVDLTDKSAYSLNNNFTFDSYIQEEQLND
ncbi:MAG: hypothetical protein J5710_09800 [Treponema sp.]|nr:hypothetical protein [Treponema sp.]